MFALAFRKPVSPGTSLKFAALAGIGDTFANVTLLLAASAAVGSSELSVVAVLSAFFPAATVVWARFMLHERLGPIRIGGLSLGLVAIALMTLG
jgi:drug/metabolite transporter (DMT)-like permease